MLLLDTYVISELRKISLGRADLNGGDASRLRRWRGVLALNPGSL
jgi:hypothetical protein